MPRPKLPQCYLLPWATCKKALPLLMLLTSDPLPASDWMACTHRVLSVSGGGALCYTIQNTLTTMVLVCQSIIITHTDTHLLKDDDLTCICFGRDLVDRKCPAAWMESSADLTAGTWHHRGRN